MKRIFRLLLTISLLFSLFGIYTKAAGSVNGDGEEGTDAATGKCGSSVCWYRTSTGNDDGVRITVIDIGEDGTESTPVDLIDYSNKSHNNYYYFDYIPKNYYFVGDSVSLKSGYSNKVPASPMPWVMKADGSNNMNEVKTWFSTEGSVKGISDDIGMSYDELTNGNYKLLIEPIIYAEVKFGTMWQYIAMTPTQMALYDSAPHRIFYNAGKNIFHSTFAKAMFLQNDDLGFTARSPQAKAHQDNDYIVDYLGMAIVSFTPSGEEEIPEEPTPIPEVSGVGSDATYRYNTDVYANFQISSNIDRTKENPITYSMVGSKKGTLCTSNVEVPANKTQMVWCKLRTPNASVGYASETVSVYADGSKVGQFTITYQNVEGFDPPDTKADDVKPLYWGYRSFTTPTNLSNTWSKWYSVRQTDMAHAYDYRQYSCDYYNWEVVDYTPSYPVYDENGKILYYEGGESIYGWVYERNETGEDQEKYYYKFYKHGGWNLKSMTPKPSSGSTRCEYKYYEGTDNMSAPFIDTFKVSINAETTLEPDPNGDPHATYVRMKSGYGIINETTVNQTATRISTGGYGGSGYSAEHTGAQNSVASFPEFEYITYQRVMERMSNTPTQVRFEFKKNKYDFGNERTHFTPIWYPDRWKYEVRVRVMDQWTPAGMLQHTVSDYVAIEGSLFDDWAITKGSRKN